MSASSNSQSNNNISNVASLEHCYTNLFSLIDLTGIKWLKLRAKDEKDLNKNVKQLSNKKEISNGEDDSNDDEDDDDISDDRGGKTNQSTPKRKQKTNNESSSLFTSSMKDPILLAHSKLLKDDILSSWKRINSKKIKKSNSDNEDDDDEEEDEEENKNECDDNLKQDENFDLINNSNLKKELWIFWFEKEEPPSLKSIITSDLFVDNSSNSANNLSFNNYNNNNNNNNSSSSSMTQLAITSTNGLPYECRSMLFKALHNLIEKSLIEKGFTKLGKWFVMPYNQPNLNDKLNDDFEFDNLLINSKLSFKSKNDLLNDEQQTSSINPQSLQSSNESNACSPLSTTGNSKLVNGKGKINNKLITTTNQLSSMISSSSSTTSPQDQYNHVSYSFSFFLHGSSRVCTSVDMKLHKPLRILNTNDLFKLKYKMTQSFSYKTTQNQQKKNQKIKKFKGLNVILAPYGISAHLIGYLSNDSLESKSTCLEWQQFYSFKLYSNLPRVFVVGLENNKVKLFYPNSFVFMIVKEQDKNMDKFQSQPNFNFDEMLLSDCSSNGSDNYETEPEEDQDNEQDEISDSNDSSSSDSESSDEEDDDYEENKENYLLKRKSLNKKSTDSSATTSQLTPSKLQLKTKLLATKSQNKSTANKLGRTNSLNSGIDLILSSKNNEKEMDSLELTIDSVARNFGTNLKDDTDDPMVDSSAIDDDDDFNLSVPPVDEPQQDDLNLSPFQTTKPIQSPSTTIKIEPNTSPLLKQTTAIKLPLKRNKSILSNKTNNFKQKYKSFSSFSTNRNKIIKFQSSNSANKTNDLFSNEKELKNVLNKLKKSELLNNLFNSSPNNLKKMKNLLKLFLKNKKIQQKIEFLKSKKEKNLKTKTNFNKKLNSIRQFRLFVSTYNDNNFKDLNQRIHKIKRNQRRKQLLQKKCNKCTNESANNSMLNDEHLLTSPINKSKTNCKCCRLDYSTENHILLKHKQIDLLRENLPLSFDLLDKCQLNISNRFNETLNQRNNLFRSKFQQNQCKCNSSFSNEETLNKTPNKLPKIPSNKLNDSTIKQETTELIDGKTIKLEPFSIIKTESPTLDTQKPKINLINISTQLEPFHRRQCYFTNHGNNEPVVLINKTIQLNSKSSKEARGQLIPIKTININEEYLNEQQNDELKTNKCECSKPSDELKKEEIDIDEVEHELEGDEIDEDDFDYSTDDSSKDLMKEIEKMEKQMSKSNSKIENEQQMDESKRIETELNNFILKMNKNELLNDSQMNLNEIDKLNSNKQSDESEEDENEIKTNQMDENNYQFFSLDDNDSLLEAIKTTKTDKFFSSSSSSSSTSSTSNSDDDDSLSSLSTVSSSNTSLTTTSSDESNCKSSSDSTSSDSSNNDNERQLLNNLNIDKKNKKLNLDNYLFSNENDNLNSKIRRKLKKKKEKKKSLKIDSQKSLLTNSEPQSLFSNEENLNNLQEEEEENDLTFDKLYELNQQQTIRNEIRIEDNLFADSTRLPDYEIKSEDGSNQLQQQQPPSSNKQMTPPKSNESTQPLSNNPSSDILPRASLFQTNKTNNLISSSLTSTAQTTTNNILPPKYEDLNNLELFEDESADEQQLQQTAETTTNQDIAPSLNTFTTNSFNKSLVLPSSSHQQHQSVATPCLSVVMTPPSHENIQQINQLNQLLNEDNLFPSSNQSINSTNFSNSNEFEFTKSMKLNDYMTLTQNKQREKFSSLLIKSLNETTTTLATNNNITNNVSSSIYTKFEKLNELKIEKEKKKIKKLKKDYNFKQTTKLKWSPDEASSSAFDLKKSINKQTSPKKQFKSLIKSINISLDKISNSVSNLNSNKNNSSTYVHLNANKQQQQQQHNNSSIILLDSPQQQQQQQRNNSSLQRTNSLYSYPPMSNASMTSYTAPSTPINPQQQYQQQQQYQMQQVNSPYQYSVNSVNSYPGSVPPPSVNNTTLNMNSNITTTPTNNNTIIGPGSVGPNNNSQLSTYNQMNQNNSTLQIDSPSILEEEKKQINEQINNKLSTVSNELIIKPLENLSILNEKNYLKSNLNLKFYLNSLCLSLNMSDTFNNCYRDINFDSCTLCVCNNNSYLKGLDYSIYILNDLFNSSYDYYNDNFNSLNPFKTDLNDDSSDDDLVEEQDDLNLLNGRRIRKAFKGIYIIRNELDKKEKQILRQKQQSKQEQIDSANNQQPQQEHQHQECTCGFSSIVNRQLLSQKAFAVNFNYLIKEMKRNKANKSQLVPYFKLIDLINATTTGNKMQMFQQLQFIVINSNNCNGLFYEDYLESLNLNVPHSLLKQLIKLREDHKNMKNYLLNSILIRENYKWKKSFTFNSKSLLTNEENDSKKVKKSTTLQLPNGTTTINNQIDLIDENITKKQEGQFEFLKNNLLDLFEQKYSSAFLSLQEQHDLFYLNERHSHQKINDISNEQEEVLNISQQQQQQDEIKKKKKKSTKSKLINLNQLDENKSCSNVLKRLILKTKQNKLSNENSTNKISNNLLHKWLYDKKEIKSNLELTKSLKQIQPLLEETVQKKFTTSKMWESFQGPLTWQHFCRLAFRETSSNNISSHHHQSNGNPTANSSTSAASSNGTNANGSSSNSNNSTNPSGANSSSNNSSNNSNQSANPSSANNSSANNHQQQQNCYEPEPIPSLLVSSAFDKDWLAISPYAIKFWDKLSLEPYSKPKNIAYIVLVPEFDSNLIDLETLNVKNLNFEENDPFNYSKKLFHQNNKRNENSNLDEQMNQSIKDYFKELTSIYELCRLGLHRPALRIAPDNGFIRVPLFKANPSAATTSTSALNKNIKMKSSNETTKIEDDILKPKEEDTNQDIKPTGIIGFSKINSDNSLTKDLNNSNKIQIDQWFEQIQENKSANLVGKNLKSFAKIFKLLAMKISSGYQSTLATTIQSSFFSNSSANNTIPPQLNTFASSIIPTHSSINLDRTIYDEFKPSRYTNTPSVASQAAAIASSLTANSAMNASNNLTTNILSGSLNDSNSSSLLSNLLNQNTIQPIEINLEPTFHQFPISHNPTSPIDLNSHNSLTNPHQQAQILTNYNQNITNNSIDDSVFSTSHHSLSQSSQSQQHKTPQPSQNSHLTVNITSSPVLFVYIIDPFDQYLYNTNKKKTTLNNKKKQQKSTKSKTNDDSIDLDKGEEANKDDQEQQDNQNDIKFNEFDLKRLRTLGLFKAYLELLDNIPDLFKYSLQFQIIPLSVCLDSQQQSTSLYTQSIMQLKQSKSNYSNCFSTGLGSGCSDLDMDFKMSILKMQAFNVFSLSKRYFMSPAHNYYLQIQQQQLQQFSTRSRTLTYFGPTGAEERFLKDNLLQAASKSGSAPIQGNKLANLDQMKKLSFYSPLFILAPSTISNSTVALAASNLFFKNKTDLASETAGTTPTTANKSNSLTQQQNIGIGECNSLMPNFIQLNMSNSNYGYLTNNPIVTSTTTTTSASSTNKNNKNELNTMNTNSITQQPYQQQCNVLFVSYCLSEDQRYLLTSCCDENGELLESTSISIEIDERDRRKNNQYARRIGLRKLWEFIIVLISQTCKPWRIVIGRLGRIGHSELRGWGCLLSKKNLQRVCNELKEQCESCNIFGNMEMPSILSACLISMETCDNICIYPESYSREDKLAAAALNGQQLSSNHLAQSYGVSCTHILTFPASAIVQPQSSSIVGSNKEGADGLSKSDLHPMDEDFFNFFGAGMGDEEEMMADLISDDVNAKGFNESGNNNEGDQNNAKEKLETLLNQEEIPHLDQQPLAVGYYISTAKCGPLPDWFRGDVSLDTNFHSFKSTLHIHNRYSLENDELVMQMKTEYSHKLDSSITYEVLRYVLERYNALSWLNIDPLSQDRKSCLPLHHTTLLQLYYSFKNYI